MTSATEDTRDREAVHRRIVDIVASRTLYEESYLQPDSHFEADLGIDSVILESILASVNEDFALSPPLTGDPTTIRELVDAVRRARGDGEEDARGDVRDETSPDGAETTAEGDAAAEGDAVLETVLAAAQRHTAYARHQLPVDADLESELGIDSVLLASVLADASRDLGLAHGLADGLADSPGASTLRGLADGLRAARDAGGPAAPAAPAAQEAPSPQAAPEWDGRSMKDFVEKRDPDLFAKTRSFAPYLRRREAEHLYWYGMPLRSRCGNKAVILDEQTGREREFLMFASNNYLGLANHPRVVEAVCEATRSYGATHTGSRFIGGTNTLHKELERRLAAFKQRPACIVYPGGYAANLGTISALVKSYDTLVVDRLNHMSIADGARLSGGIRKIYQHNDMADLERILKRADDRSGGRLIVADGVFSMHGDLCDLPEIVRLAKEHDARVMIDDAHATGVLGERGTGTTEHFGLKGEVDLELGTMSKALAGMGGFVVGEEEVIEYLRYYANSYVFAANIPAGVAAGLIAAIDVIEAEPGRITRLWDNIRFLHGQLADAGFDLENTRSAILPLVVGDERKAMEMGRAVRARGLYCQTVVFPGVPLGDARLRVSVTSEHTREDLENAAGIFVEAAREVGVLPSAA
ncbi:aminotransferase class I/II-fold pyridoxal phosphate-dependent enzyme [Streptomyces griseoaurantiacus]|uniref:aminotransferase class I/II-fold pyridoxal phosphate-dependent enzyme n=1 Tax=Streptomyces griseoaurantiacus TaxID=68213 RepID=UPI00352D1183